MSNPKKIKVVAAPGVSEIIFREGAAGVIHVPDGIKIEGAKS